MTRDHHTAYEAGSVTMVIPGRNCARTLPACLEAAVAILQSADSPLGEIIFVDDGSTDESRNVAMSFPIQIVQGIGKGPGAARNLGWRAAKREFIWFVDADCVAEANALQILLGHLRDPAVGGVGGSYGNMQADSLLATLIHEEIVERHRAMPDRVDFLATFNVVYRREALIDVGGFDERFLKAQDAELSWRVLEAGYELAFDAHSRVHHFHPVSLSRYLETQRQQGYWRVWLHLEHRGHALGNSYSNMIDHCQPPLALATVLSLAWVWLPFGWWVSGSGATILMAMQIPMTIRLIRRVRRWSMAYFAPLGWVRAFWRGAGMAGGALDVILRKNR